MRKGKQIPVSLKPGQHIFAVIKIVFLDVNLLHMHINMKAE